MKREYNGIVAKLVKSNPIKPAGAKRKKVATRAIGAPSRLTGKKPSARLIARRKKNTQAGYYPNPIKSDFKKTVLKHAQGIIDSQAVARSTLSNRLKYEKYISGLMDALVIHGSITTAEARATMNEIRKAWGL